MQIDGALLANRGVYDVKQPTSLEEAAREFEAMMLTELLKAARKAGEAFGAEPEDNGAKSYREFADENSARALPAEDVLGFGRLVIRELQPVARTPLSSVTIHEFPRYKEIVSGLT